MSTLGNYNHSHDSGVVCGRFVDHCDLSSTRDEACSCKTTTVPISNVPNRNEDPSCPSDMNTAVYATIIGVLFTLLIAVIIGWIVMCIVIIPKRKGVTE